jgi:hypothetical protein
MWTILIAMLVVGLAAIVWKLGLAIYTHTVKKLHELAELRMDLAGRRISLTRSVYPDQAGNYPLLWDGQHLLDPGRGLLYTLADGLRAASPEVARPEQLRRLLQGAGGWPQAKDADSIPALLGQTTTWPQADLLALFQSRQPTLNFIVIGVDKDGNPVGASLHELMHVLAVGASGWGKSSWLRSFLWQIAKTREPVDVVAIDINGSEFNALQGWGKLRYPVARETGEAIALLQEVGAEIALRKALYEARPSATKLTEYNDVASEPLSPWVVAVDEGTNLLNQPGLGELLRGAVQTARQYGVYILLAGQSAKHTVIDTQVRDNFSTRLCFRTSPTSSRVVLDHRAAGDLQDKGRAWVQMAGRELCEVQGPYITREDFIKALTNSGPKLSMPEIIGGSGSREERIRELAEGGLSKRQIALEVFGYDGGAAYQAVTDVLGDTTTT